LYAAEPEVVNGEGLVFEPAGRKSKLLNTPNHLLGNEAGRMVSAAVQAKTRKNRKKEEGRMVDLGDR
jgi:hypothetical protein